MSKLSELQETCRKIIVNRYEKNISIGVLSEEHQKLQPVIFYIEAYCQRESRLEDHIASVYDYRSLIAAIDKTVADTHIELQETLVERIADLILQDKRIRAVLVSSAKPQAYKGAQSIGVEILRFN